jgi:hypothetical protein
VRRGEWLASADRVPNRILEWLRRRDDVGAMPMTDFPELTASDFERAIPASLRERLMRGELTSGGLTLPEDVA